LQPPPPPSPPLPQAPHRLLTQQVFLAGETLATPTRAEYAMSQGSIAMGFVAIFFFLHGHGDALPRNSCAQTTNLWGVSGLFPSPHFFMHSSSHMPHGRQPVASVRNVGPAAFVYLPGQMSRYEFHNQRMFQYND
jgi:hypothetical protein